MRLTNGNGDFLELSIDGYQFPINVHDKHDANWLMIRGSASLDGRHWTFRDPMYLTWEVAELISWLEKIERREVIREWCAGLEPNLEWQHTDGSKIRIHFQLEARPPWSQSDTTSDPSVTIDFPSEAGQLRPFIEKLKAELARIPNEQPTPSPYPLPLFPV